MSTTSIDRAARRVDAEGQRLAEVHMRDLFASDPDRFERYALSAGPILADCARHRLDDAALEALVALAEATDVAGRRDAMFRGERINTTEGRAVGHVALRGSAPGFCVDGHDAGADIAGVLARMAQFSQSVRDGRWVGHTGRTVTDVVNIGIGGSDLGPLMVCEALAYRARPDLRAHFVSNVDGTHLAATLQGLDPHRTLFIIASKTFTTRETLMNARSARAWLVDAVGAEAAVARHFVAVSTNADGVRAFGIDTDNMFGFWDWVGGRYSLWGAIGLPIACVLGMEEFEALHAGARAMDQHFAQAPLRANLPVRLALLGYWYGRCFDARSHAVLPYDQALHRFPAFLQQLDMESNGKSVRLDGSPVTGRTGPVVWGEPGTNGQHAFYQLLHQGTHLVPADFIVPARSHHPLGDHHRVLVANCVAQSEALMLGRSLDTVQREMAAAGETAEAIAAIAPHRVFPGNRPSTTLVLEQVDAHALGALVALYEHKVFVQGVLFGINSFDQWGVELGKQLAAVIERELDPDTRPDGRHDASTNGLIAHLRALGAGNGK